MRTLTNLQIYKSCFYQVSESRTMGLMDFSSERVSIGRNVIPFRISLPSLQLVLIACGDRKTFYVLHYSVVYFIFSVSL